MHTTFDRCFHHDGIWLIDPHDEPEIYEEAYYPTPFTQWIEEEFTSFKHCPYCNTKLEKHSYFEEDEKEPPRITWGVEPELAWLWSCPYCAYWQWFSLFENRGMHGNAAMSVLSRFDPTIPEECSNELAQHLRRNESLWAELTPKGMERLVADIFRANHSHADVIHVGKPGDLGIDVIFVESNGKRSLIQVKRREDLRTVEGFETLQKLLGTLVLEGELQGVVASNASHFSYQAKREAKRAALRGYTIKLLDRGKLNRMLGAMLPDRPWQIFAKEVRFPDELIQRFSDATSDPKKFGRQLTLFDDNI